MGKQVVEPPRTIACQCPLDDCELDTANMAELMVEFGFTKCSIQIEFTDLILHLGGRRTII